MFVKILMLQRDVAQFGSALEWGSRGREFDSRHSDHKSNDFTLEIVGFFSFVGWPHLVLTTILTTMPTILSGLISAVLSNF